MTRPVIVGTDGTDPATQAVRTAAELAAAFDAELVVATAFGRSEGGHLEAGGDDFFFDAVSEAETVAQNSIEELRALHPHLHLTPRAEEGKPGAALVRVAEESDARLVVVGNKRVQGISRLLGSIATHVAQNAPCDVYIAHTHSYGKPDPASKVDPER